ncbi:hypothetical protein CVT24_005856 [Panaeolus cyanescens]|uniref:Zinc finger PHD-type domain-containing protein n=1 Tax=Panaeolus cyanescens TaxID=181874 RepID=A0A409YEZ6_9AGAR|nr:hypothetical protein CVT24_005856 [Panaeolus cyanescens]
MSRTPDLQIILDCRCGSRVIAADKIGDILPEEREIHGEVICCRHCKTWSHIACQRYGRASNLHPDNTFRCDACDPNFPFLILRGTNDERSRTSIANLRREHQTMELASRLRPGRGALAKHGEFYYPVRLIRKVMDGWIVVWWRENQFPCMSIPPGSFVSQLAIVDSLWHDSNGRRQIRLGKWIHAVQASSAEDLLADPSSIPYSTTVNNILSPHIRIFHKLSMYDLNIEDEIIPVKTWIQSINKPPRSTPVPFVGRLSITERAQIANWFDRRVTHQDPKRRLDWLARMPIAHAYTVYIAFHLSQDCSHSGLAHEDLMRKAWDIQVQGRKTLDVDVDVECLYDLELDMFEVSAEASTAGFYQWGLDAGHHQDNWYPYSGLPEEWRKECCPLSDDEECLQRGPDYLEYIAPTTARTGLQSRPRPRIKGSHQQSR